MLEARELQAADYEVICGFAQTPEELFYMAPSADYPWTADRFAEAVAKRQANTVFTQAGTIIGFANIYKHAPGEKGFIGNLVVNPAFRGRGAGKQILHHMLVLAFTTYHYQAVHISCFGTNTAGLLLYDKLGFRPYALEQRTDYANRPAVLLHLKLTAEQYSTAQSGLDLDQITAKLTDI